jgi:hypothetical protein
MVGQSIELEKPELELDMHVSTVVILEKAAKKPMVERIEELMSKIHRRGEAQKAGGQSQREGLTLLCSGSLETVHY